MVPQPRSLRAASFVPRPPIPGHAAVEADLAHRLGPALHRLLSVARGAPSGHNAQPWVVSVSPAGDRVDVGVARDRRLPAVDPGDRELMISLGAFTEALVQAAPLSGLVATLGDVARVYDPAEPVVSLALAAGPEDDDPARAAALNHRRTLRKGLRSEPLPGPVIDRLLHDLPDARMVPRSTAEAETLAQATVAAVRAQVARDDVQRELGDWIRWSGAAAARRPTGLTPAAMEIDGLAGWWARHAFGPGTPLTTGFRRASVRMVGRQVRQGAGWIVITTPDDTPPSLIRAGRAYLRIALRAWHVGVGVHPMSQALEQPETRRALSRPGGAPQMILRIGRVDHLPPAIGPRLPVAAFTRIG